MIKEIYLTIIAGIFLLYGCFGPENFFSNDVTIIDKEYKIYDTITGEKLSAVGLYHISSLIYFDEYLLVLTPRANNVFNVLTFNGEIMSQFGTIGRANDELMNCQFNGQTERIDGDNCIWINDVSKARMVLIDIDKSIRSSKIIINKEIKTPPMSVYCFCVNDSLLIAEQFNGNNYELFIHNVILNKLSHETLYSNDAESAFSLYKSIWLLDLCRNRMVGAMQSVNQMNFYSIKDQKKYSIVVGEQKTDKNELIDTKTGLERTTTFCDLEMTDSNIYALYMNQNYDDAYEKSKPQEILIFDLSGRLERVICLNEYIIDITISGDEKYLYGRTPDDNIYRYRLDF